MNGKRITLSEQHMMVEHLETVTRVLRRDVMDQLRRCAQLLHSITTELQAKGNGKSK
jgi:hypothetical protein